MDSTSAARRETCPLCDRRRSAADVAGLEWSSEHGPGGVVTWTCGPCTRSELWRIETNLAPQRVQTVRAA
jgi:hypothetical protein